MKYLYLVFFLSVSYLAVAQNIEDDLIWAKEFHKVGLTSFLVETDNSDNIYLSATYLGCPNCFIEWQGDTLISGGNNSYDMFICKLDPEGGLMWFDVFGSSSDEYLAGFQVDHENNPIMYMSNSLDINYQGETLGAGYNLVKLDTEGNFLLNAHMTGAYHDPNGNGTFGQQKKQFSVTCNNDLVIMGMIWGTLNIDGQTISSAPFTNIFIAQFNSSGQLDWVNHYDHSEWIDANSIDASYNQEIIVSGGFANENLNLDGTILEWDDSGSGSENIFLIKLNSDGELVWAQNYFSNLLGANNTVDQEGNSLVLGQFLGSTICQGDTLETYGLPSDLVLFKVDSDGNYLWSRKIGNQNSNGFGHVLTNSESEIYFSGDMAPQNGEFMGKFDEDGEELWTYEPEGFGNYLGRDLAFDKNGNLIETGFFNGEISFGDEPLGNGSQWNNFILKFANQSLGDVNQGCQDIDNVISISGGLENNIQVYPNPSEGLFEVSLVDFVSSTNVQATLYNSTGKTVVDRYLSLQELLAGKMTLNLNKEMSGVYLLSFSNSEGFQSVRLVKS